MLVKLSAGELFTIEEVNKNGYIDFQITHLPEVGNRIFLSSSQVSSFPEQIINSLIEKKRNYVNAIIFDSDGCPIIMLGRNPKLIRVHLLKEGKLLLAYLKTIPNLGEKVFLSESKEGLFVHSIIHNDFGEIVIKLCDSEYNHKVFVNNVVETSSSI